MDSVLEVKIFRLKGEKTVMLPSCIFQIEYNYNIQIMAIYGQQSTELYSIHFIFLTDFTSPVKPQKTLSKTQLKTLMIYLKTLPQYFKSLISKKFQKENSILTP